MQSFFFVDAAESNQICEREAQKPLLPPPLFPRVEFHVIITKVTVGGKEVGSVLPPSFFFPRLDGCCAQKGGGKEKKGATPRKNLLPILQPPFCLTILCPTGEGFAKVCPGEKNCKVMFFLAKHLANLCVCSRFYCRGWRGDDGWSAGSNTSVGLMARCVRRRSTVDPRSVHGTRRDGPLGEEGRRESAAAELLFQGRANTLISPPSLPRPTDRRTLPPPLPPPRSQCVGGDYGHPPAAAVARGQKLMVLGADLAPSASAVALDSQEEEEEEEEEEVTAVSGRTSFFQWTYRMLGAPFLLPPLLQALPRATASERGKKGASETNDRITPSSSFGPLGGAVLRQESPTQPNPTGQPGQ